MRKHILIRLGIIAALTPLLFCAPEIASAQAITASQTFVNSATQLILFIVTILNFLTWFILSILDHIMNPQFIFATDPVTGADTGLLLMLHEIWQFVRDLVNIGFAIALIIGSVMMIVTADGTHIKEHLPRFVLALVLVNFSWFVPRVIFDFSQVMTYTIYQIPSLLNLDGCTLPPKLNDVERRPCTVVLQYRFLPSQTQFVGADGIDRSPGQANTTGWSCPLRPLVCIQTVNMENADAQVTTQTKVLDGLVVNHARLQWLAQINIADEIPRGIPEDEAVRRMIGIVAKLVIVLIMHIAIAFPLVAMAVAFFIRIPVLWVSIAFMPLVALGYAFPKLREGEYKDLFWEWQNHFFQAVFLPVRVAIPFAIGFIMLNAGAKAGPPANFGNVPFLPIFSGVSDMWQMVWMLVALFIIWKYSFDALKADKAGLMGQFTDKIEGIGSSLGSIAGQLPLSVPFIPIPGRINPQTGKNETISIGQGLRALDPRHIAADLRNLGKFEPGGFARRAGLTPLTKPDLVDAFKKTLNPGNPVTVNVQNDLRKAGDKTVLDVKLRAENLRSAIDKLKASHPELVKGRTMQEVVEALIKADPVIAADLDLQAEIRKILKPMETEKIT